MVSLILTVFTSFAFAQVAQTSGIYQYQDGIPVVRYKGEVCEQSQSQITPSGRTNITAYCYDYSFDPERQCSFYWLQVTRLANFTISTYERSTSAAAKVISQNTFKVKSLKVDTYREAAQLGSELMDKYCGMNISFTDNKKYYTWKETLDGMKCGYTEVRRQSGPVDWMIFVCYRDNFNTQCGVDYQIESWKAGTFVGTARHYKNYYLFRENTTNQKAFDTKDTPVELTSDGAKKSARAWLSKYCK